MGDNGGDTQRPMELLSSTTLDLNAFEEEGDFGDSTIETSSRWLGFIIATNLGDES